MTTLTVTPQELDNLLTTPPVALSSPKQGLSSPLLQLLASAGRELTSQFVTEQFYPQGHIVFQENNPGNSMHIIWSGRAVVVKGSFQSPTILGYRSAGDIIGEMALLEDQTRSASIVAVEDMRTLQIQRQDFEKLLTTAPSLCLKILKTLSARLRVSDDARKLSARSETSLIKQLSGLQVEKQKLLELEQLREDTIHLIVHDLRHPISSLMGAVKILEMVLPEEVLEANQQILEIAGLNCDQLQLMVDSLLDLARMESGQSQLELSKVDLTNLIQENINKIHFFASMESITIQASMPQDLPLLTVDIEKIDRVLSNLLNNAIKYTPAGEQIMIDVKVEEDTISTSITDSGHGIPPDEQDRIFDRYVQLSDTETRAGGFGLGLAFCQLAVEAHGGKIWVESGENNKGSKFTFTLPLT